MTINVWDDDYICFSDPLKEMLELIATYGEGDTKRHHNKLNANGVVTNFHYLPNLLSYIERGQTIHDLLSELQKVKIEIELDKVFEKYNQNIPQMFKILLLFNKWYPTECRAMFSSWSDNFEEKLIHKLKLLVSNYKENNVTDSKNWAEMFFCFQPENYPIVSEILKDLELDIISQIYPQKIHKEIIITSPFNKIADPQSFLYLIHQHPNHRNQPSIRPIELEYNFLFANRHELLSYGSSALNGIYRQLNDKTRLEMIALILLLPKFNNIDNCPISATKIPATANHFLNNIKELLKETDVQEDNKQDWKRTAKKILYNYSNPAGGVQRFWGLGRTHIKEAYFLHEKIKSLDSRNLEEFLQEINITITSLYDNGSIGHYLVALILIKSLAQCVWDQDKRTTFTNQMPVKSCLTSSS